MEVVKRLEAYGTVVQFAEERVSEMKGHTFLLQLHTQDGTLTVSAYDDRAKAADVYSEVERQIEGDPSRDAVLVAVESLATLRRAFPNYFADTSAFLESVERAIE